jgi:GT2 family glycosyltransferase
VNGITASVVLYNTPEAQLVRLLDCIRASSIEVQTYLVDNSPVPLSYPCLRQPGVIYRATGSNRGYGAGHNIALRQILRQSAFHFVLNPDIYFGREDLERMIRFMDSDPSIGQLMPRVLYPDGELQYLCKLVPTPADLFLRRFAVGPFRQWAQRNADRFELRQTGYDKVMDVPYLSGCFMLFRTAALSKVGLFDERFFMYPEDIDITRRMHARFRTVFYPGATVIHDHARESYKSARALRSHIWNMIRYFNKWGWFRDPERTRFNRETLRRLADASGPSAVLTSTNASLHR